MTKGPALSHKTNPFLFQKFLTLALMALVMSFFLTDQILAQDQSALEPSALSPSPAESPSALSPSPGPAPAQAEPSPEPMAFDEPTPEQLSAAALTPEVMITEAPLTEADFEIFVAMYNYILYGSERLNFNTFSANLGIPLRRLNYISAKISLPLGESARRGQTINELGLGVLMNGPEWELFLARKTQLEELTAAMKRAMSR
ncbi:MAG: hypothetical protein LBE80_08515 [Deltaproteobacteria bacterium]|jgi:hypothetical protein|nr:hypothetical protein [Deltaproteobacteria bacterium]